MEDYNAVEKFFDYLVIDDDGWRGVREDAPTEVKQAYDEYSKRQKVLDSEGIKV